MTGVQQALLMVNAASGPAVPTAVHPFPITSVGDTMDANLVQGDAAGFALSSGGQISLYPLGVDTHTTSSVWVTPAVAGVGSAFWARVTVVSGTAPDIPGNSAGVWHSLSTDRSWWWVLPDSSVVTSIAAVINVEISTDSGGSTIVASRSGIAVSVRQVAAGTSTVQTIADGLLCDIGLSATGIISSGYIEFTANGEIDFRGGGSLGSIGTTATAPRAWRYPAKWDTSLYCKLTRLSGAALSGGSTTGWNDNGSWSVTGATTGQAVAICKIEISSAPSGSPIIATYTNVQIGYAHDTYTP